MMYSMTNQDERNLAATLNKVRLKVSEQEDADALFDRIQSHFAANREWYARTKRLKRLLFEAIDAGDKERTKTLSEELQDLNAEVPEGYDDFQASFESLRKLFISNTQ